MKEKDSVVPKAVEQTQKITYDRKKIQKNPITDAPVSEKEKPKNRCTK